MMSHRGTGWARNKLKKLDDLVIGIELAREILMPRLSDSAEKFDHPFSHVFIFRNMFLKSHGFLTVPVTSSNNFVFRN